MLSIAFRTVLPAPIVLFVVMGCSIEQREKLVELKKNPRCRGWCWFTYDGWCRFTYDGWCRFTYDGMLNIKPHRYGGQSGKRYPRNPASALSGSNICNRQEYSTSRRLFRPTPGRAVGEVTNAMQSELLAELLEPEYDEDSEYPLRSAEGVEQQQSRGLLGIHRCGQRHLPGFDHYSQLECSLHRLSSARAIESTSSSPGGDFLRRLAALDLVVRNTSFSAPSRKRSRPIRASALTRKTTSGLRRFMSR
jgi:hypothetical protein